MQETLFKQHSWFTVTDFSGICISWNWKDNDKEKLFDSRQSDEFGQ